MKRTLWVLLDDRMGSVGQARGVCAFLKDKVEISEKQVVYNRLAALPNFIRGKSFIGVNLKQSSDFSAPMPDMILSSSRRTLPIARKIKKLSGNKTKIIQLMHPGNAGIREIDLTVVPEHDAKKCKKGNFMMITGCPHRVTPQNIKEAQKQWKNTFAKLPRPYTTVVVGGSIKKHPFSLENATKLSEEIIALQQKIGGSILITTSRRTGKEAENIIKNKLAEIPAYTYWWGEKKENPIMGFWACADRIITTGDSVSMTCEACGSGKPVLVFEGENWLTPKHHRFIKSLYENNYAIALEDDKALEFVPTNNLNPAQEIADRILELI